MTDPIRILLVDDHEIVRAGLASLLRGVEDIQVVGEAASGREAVRLAGSLHPDLVLMDIKMPDLDGLEAASLLREQTPATAVLMLTMFDEPAYLRKAILSGAAGYLLKGVERNELITAIRRVVGGETLFDPALLPRLLDQLGQERGRDRVESPGLTARELDVLREIVAGRTNQEIARALSISVETVKTHVQRVIQKLHASDRTQAAVFAVSRGLVSPPDATR